jgi:hypothetical protein
VTAVRHALQGRVRCVGVPLELKARHCGGYTVHARLPRATHRAFLAALRAALPAAAVTPAGVAGDVGSAQGSGSDALVATVAADGLDVASLFAAVHDLHAAHTGGEGGGEGSGGYAVAQASLEEVFMKVAGEVEELEADE